MCSHVQSRKLAHVSAVHCHMRVSLTSGCAFVYFAVQWGTFDFFNSKATTVMSITLLNAIAFTGMDFIFMQPFT